MQNMNFGVLSRAGPGGGEPQLELLPSGAPKQSHRTVEGGEGGVYGGMEHLSPAFLPNS